MAQQTINVGAAPNDGTGTPLRTAFQYTNSNFTELYTAVGPSGNNIVVPGNATISGAANFNGGALAAYLNGSLLVGSSGNVVNLYAQGSGLHIKNNTGTFPLLTVNNSGDYTFQDGAGGTRMTLNSTGLGVGVSPSYKLDVLGTGNAGILGVTTTGQVSSLRLRQTQNLGPNTRNWEIRTNGLAYGNLEFAVGASQQSDTYTAAMLLDASGNLLVGTTTSLANTSHSFQATGTTNSFWAGTFQHNGTANDGRVLNWKLANANDTGSYFVFANNSGGNCFNVLGNGNVQNTTGTYGTISDLRLKENISDARNYLADLLKLRVVKYSLKSESSPTANLIGLIAQEVEQVFPTLVETNGDDVKSIKTTVLIPMLLKALQELTARVQTLETR